MTATEFVQGRGVSPPAGIQPGTPQYDQWASEYLANAVAAGDPAAIAASGGGTPAAPAGGAPAAPAGGGMTPAEVRANAQKLGLSEDYARYSDAELQDWLNRWPYDPATGKFTNAYGDKVDKPDERGPNTPAGYNGTGDRGNYGAGGGGGGGDFGGGGGGESSGVTPDEGGGYGGAPTFDYENFVAPTWEEALADPGYQFSLQQGTNALEKSAAARGTLRTSGTLKDLIGYGQDRAAQQYSDVWNRKAGEFGINYQTAKDEFAPLYGSWQTVYGGDLQKWQTRYGGNLQKYLQRENNIYGLLNTPPPAYPGY